jgi:hypothetical protein
MLIKFLNSKKEYTKVIKRGGREKSVSGAECKQQAVGEHAQNEPIFILKYYAY